MALSGALADIEVVELLQFPSSGRRSGELIIDKGDQRAKLYYAKGRLVHATLGDLKGPPVLVKVVGWRTGDFVFHGEVVSPETSIEMDVHHAVLNAVRQRDEEEEAAQRRRAGGAGVDPRAAPLQAFVAANAWALQVALISAEGRVLAEASREEGAELAAQALVALVAGWPRGGLKRCLVEDEGGVSLALPLPGGEVLLLAAARTVAIGMVSVAAGKLAASLDA